MAERYELDAEQRQHLKALVRSEGWRLFLRHLYIPWLTQVSQRLDHRETSERETQYWRGYKHALRDVTDRLYQAASEKNPLDETTVALLRALQPEQDNAPDSDTHDTLENQLRTQQPWEGKRRASSPVF